MWFHRSVVGRARQGLRSAEYKCARTDQWSAWIEAHSHSIQGVTTLKAVAPRGEKVPKSPEKGRLLRPEGGKFKKRFPELPNVINKELKFFGTNPRKKNSKRIASLADEDREKFQTHIELHLQRRKAETGSKRVYSLAETRIRRDFEMKAHHARLEKAKQEAELVGPVKILAGKIMKMNMTQLTTNEWSIQNQINNAFGFASKSGKDPPVYQKGWLKRLEQVRVERIAQIEGSWESGKASPARGAMGALKGWRRTHPKPPPLG